MSERVTDNLQSEHIHRDTILIIEDDVAIAQIIALTIDEETPFEAQFVATPQEALQVLESVRPALMLIDYQLPVMNGLQLYDRVTEQEQLKRVPAVMMSANLPWAELRKRHLVGLEKPFDIDDLLELVSKLTK